MHTFVQTFVHVLALWKNRCEITQTLATLLDYVTCVYLTVVVQWMWRMGGATGILSCLCVHYIHLDVPTEPVWSSSNWFENYPAGVEPQVTFRADLFLFWLNQHSYSLFLCNLKKWKNWSSKEQKSHFSYKFQLSEQDDFLKNSTAMFFILMLFKCKHWPSYFCFEIFYFWKSYLKF